MRLRLRSFALLFASFAVLGGAPGHATIIREAALQPKGKRYRALVPDTLDLAERAKLSVHGLTCFRNEQANYGPYGHTYFDANPPYMSDLPGGPPIGARSPRAS
jgi:hypothetical protein